MKVAPKKRTSVSPQMSASATLRRPTRRTVSCENCRARKVKCSRGNPCDHCTKRHEVCEWKTNAEPLQTEHPRVFSEIEVSALTRTIDVLASRLHLSPEAVQDLIQSHIDVNSGDSSAGEDGIQPEISPDSISSPGSPRRDSVDDHQLRSAMPKLKLPDSTVPSKSDADSQSKQQFAFPDLPPSIQQGQELHRQLARPAAAPIPPPQPQDTDLLSPPYSYNIFGSTPSDYFPSPLNGGQEEGHKPATAFGSLFSATSLPQPYDTHLFSSAPAIFGTSFWPPAAAAAPQEPAAAPQAPVWNPQSPPSASSSKVWHWHTPVHPMY